MNCVKCKTNEASVKYPNGDLCNSCFMDMLYKRAEKELKQNPLKKGESVLVVGKLAEHFLNKINKLDVHATITEEYRNESNYDTIILPWTADDEADAFYESLTKNKAEFEENKKIVKLFKGILESELRTAAKILNIPFTPKKHNEDIEKIQKKYPTAKFGLVKSAEEIRKALK